MTTVSDVTRRLDGHAARAAVSDAKRWCCARTPLRIALALAANLPFATACGVESSNRAPTATNPARPLLGVVRVDRGGPGALAAIDPRTLRARSRPVALRGHYWSVSRSPDGTQVAIGVSARARVQLVDLRRWRSRGLVHAGARGARTRGEAVTALAWTRPRRLLAVLGARPDMRSTVVVIDPVRRRVLKRTAVQGEVVAQHVSRVGIAMLVAPRAGIGPSRLGWVDASGRGRNVALERIRAGFVYPRGDVYPVAAYGARQSVPGLTVDDRREKAFVVSAGAAEVAEVDLMNGDVAYHDVSRARSVIARLRDLIEPAAEAKGLSVGSARVAQWLGEDTVAVTGEDVAELDQRRGRRETLRRFGLRLIDTREWTMQTVDSQAAFATVAGGILLVSAPGGGVTAYDRDGDQLFRRLKDKQVWLQAYAPYAYASVWERRRRVHRTFVLRLPRGRIVNTIVAARPPTLLSGYEPFR